MYFLLLLLGDGTLQHTRPGLGTHSQEPALDTRPIDIAYRTAFCICAAPAASNRLLLLLLNTDNFPNKT